MKVTRWAWSESCTNHDVKKFTRYCDWGVRCHSVFTLWQLSILSGSYRCEYGVVRINRVSLLRFL